MMYVIFGHFFLQGGINVNQDEINKMAIKGKRRALIIFIITFLSCSIPLIRNLIIKVPYSLDEYLVPIISQGAAFLYLVILLMNFSNINKLKNYIELIEPEADINPQLTEEEKTTFHITDEDEKTNSI